MEKTSYFSAMCEPPGKLESKIPLLNSIYFIISRDTAMQEIPVVSMMFSIGAMLWLFFICLWYNIYKKRKEICAVLSIILFLYITYLFGAMVLVRYVLIFFFGLPIILAFGLNGGSFKKTKKIMQ